MPTAFETLKQKATQGVEASPLGTTSLPTITPAKSSAFDTLKIKAASETPINIQEPEKKNIVDFVAPNVKTFKNLVTSGRIMKDPAYEGLLKAQESTLNQENQIRSRLMSEKDPTKIKGLQDILTSIVLQKNTNQAEIDKISKPQMVSNLSKAGTALGVGLDLGLSADLPMLGANLLRKPATMVAPKTVEYLTKTLGKQVGPDITKEIIKKAPGVLQPAMTKVSNLLAPKAITEADSLAYKAKPFMGKVKEIGMDVLKQIPESTAIGYGYDVSQGLQEGEGVGALKPGLMTGLGALLPVGVGTARVAYQPIGKVFKTLRSFGTPTDEMIKIEQNKLKDAYSTAFKMRESTDARNQFLKSQGKDPEGTLSKFGIIPDTEYTNGKTVMRTKAEGGAVDEVSDMIGKRGEQIQSTLDNVQATNPSSAKPIDVIEQEALDEAKRVMPGVDLTAIQNQIKTRLSGVRSKYGDVIGVGDMGRERIATNKGTKAWLKPQAELDADALLGNVFRKNIDAIIDDKITRQVNAEIGDLIAARKMLLAIDGKNVGGGRFTNLIASWAGAMLGSMANPGGNLITQVISSLTSALGIKMVLRMLQQGQFGGKTTKRILQYLAEDQTLLNTLIAKEPKIIRDAFMREIKASTKTKLLPSPKFGTPSSSNYVPIPMTGPASFEKPAQKIFNQSMLDNTTKQSTKQIKNDIINPIIPPAKKKATSLQPKKKDKIPNKQGGFAIKDLITPVAGLATIGVGLKKGSDYLSEKLAKTYTNEKPLIPKVDSNKLKDAIAYNESRGESKPYEFRKFSGSKAMGEDLGKYQITTEELRVYGKRFIGKTVTPDEFISSPELQDKYILGKIKSLLSRGLTPKEILAVHRSGMSDLTRESLDRKLKERADYVASGLSVYNK